MTNLDRKTTLLLHIQKYCAEIEENFKFFGTHLEVFKENNIFRDSISMKIFQIGELTKELDKNCNDFIKATENQVPWKNIIRMRERFAHHYGDMDLEIIFNTALNDIPVLNTFIQKELSSDFRMKSDQRGRHKGNQGKFTNVKQNVYGRVEKVGKNMEEVEILKGILDSYPYPIVFVDNEYIIRFMNKNAREYHEKKGRDLIGKSIFDCHHERSIEKIKKYYEEIKVNGKDIFIFVNSKNQRVYMQGVRNEKGEWIGFIERFELNLQM